MGELRGGASGGASWGRWGWVILHRLAGVNVMALVALATTIGLASDGNESDSLKFNTGVEERYQSYLARPNPTEKDRRRAADALFWMYRGSPEMAFLPIVDALEHPWPELRETAAELVCFYYVDTTYDARGEVHTYKDWPKIVGEREAHVREVLQSLAEGSCVDIGVAATISLERMSDVSPGGIRFLCEVVSGEMLNRAGICVYSGEGEYRWLRSKALNALLRLKEEKQFAAEIVECFESILNRHPESSDPIMETIEKVLGVNDDAMKSDFNSDIETSTQQVDYV
jgi:hypothetical protein